MIPRLTRLFPASEAGLAFLGGIVDELGRQPA